jgi:hypothetical protein
MKLVTISYISFFYYFISTAWGLSVGVSHEYSKIKNTNCVRIPLSPNFLAKKAVAIFSKPLCNGMFVKVKKKYLLNMSADRTVGKFFYGRVNEVGDKKNRVKGYVQVEKIFLGDRRMDHQESEDEMMSKRNMGLRDFAYARIKDLQIIGRDYIKKSLPLGVTILKNNCYRYYGKVLCIGDRVLIKARNHAIFPYQDCLGVLEIANVQVNFKKDKFKIFYKTPRNTQEVRFYCVHMETELVKGANNFVSMKNLDVSYKSSKSKLSDENQMNEMSPEHKATLIISRRFPDETVINKTPDPFTTVWVDIFTPDNILVAESTLKKGKFDKIASRLNSVGQNAVNEASFKKKDYSKNTFVMYYKKLIRAYDEKPISLEGLEYPFNN